MDAWPAARRSGNVPANTKLCNCRRTIEGNNPQFREEVKGYRYKHEKYRHEATCDVGGRTNGG